MFDARRRLPSIQTLVASSGIRVSPDQRSLLTARLDDTARLWELTPFETAGYAFTGVKGGARA